MVAMGARTGMILKKSAVSALWLDADNEPQKA